MYNKYNKNFLEKTAYNNNCVDTSSMKNIYPSDRELKLWIRDNKKDGQPSQRKAVINVYLINLVCNKDYSIGLFTFKNKYTGTDFELDYKYYSKLWWLFK